VPGCDSRSVGRTLTLVVCLWLVGCESDVDRLNRLEGDAALRSLMVTSAELTLEATASILVDSLIAVGELESWWTDAEGDEKLVAIMSHQFLTPQGEKTSDWPARFTVRVNELAAARDNLALAQRELSRFLR
jgi:hypothetical protein